MSQYNISRKVVITGIVVSIMLLYIPLIFQSLSFNWVYPSILPDWNLNAWEYVFSQSTMVKSITDSLILSGVVTIVCFALGYTTSKALGTRKIRNKSMILIMLLLPILMPSMTLCFGTQEYFVRTPFYATFTGMVLSQIVFTLPYTIFCLSSTFSNYDVDIEDQASVLGAGKDIIFFNVTIPAILPGLTVALLYTFLASWSQYLIITMVGDPAIKTLPILLFNLIGGGNFAVASALSIVFITPVLFLLVGAVYLMNRNT